MEKGPSPTGSFHNSEARDTELGTHLTLESLQPDIEPSPDDAESSAILTGRPWTMHKDRVFAFLDDLPSIEALENLLDLLAAAEREGEQGTEIILEAWDYLVRNQLWEAISRVYDEAKINTTYGMPESRTEAERGIYQNWGLGPYECLPYDLCPTGLSTSSIYLLHRLSSITSYANAVNLLRTQVILRQLDGEPDNIEAILHHDGVQVCDLLGILDRIWSTYLETTQRSQVEDGSPASSKPVTQQILKEIRDAATVLSEGLALSKAAGLSVHSDDTTNEWESDESEYQLEFPCLCEGNEYDNLGMSDFPYRRGWLIEYEDEHPYMVRSDGSESSVDEISAFVQSWLIFGVLREIFDTTLQPLDFIRVDGERRLLTFILLDRYLEAWGSSLSERDRDVNSTVHITVESCLYEMRHYSLDFPMFGVHKDILNSIGQLSKILSSVCIKVFSDPSIRDGLEMTVAISNKCRFELPMSAIPNGIIDCPFGDGQEWYIVEYKKMLRAGWCPRDVNRLLNEPIVAGNWYYYYASTLLRYVEGINHKECNKDSCLPRKIDDKTYKTKHFGNCSRCAHIKVDVSKVISILERGKLPRIVISETTTDDSDPQTQVTLDVVEDGAFVAISHVWSDRLGNVKCNSLPLCQLLRLKSQASNLYSEGNAGVHNLGPSVWIDTLCVPVQEEGRKLALRRLGKAYEDADLVLVLDAELQLISVQCCEEELLLRVVLSEWMHRLWTLEEAAFGESKLRFQLHERAVSLPDFRSRRNISRSTGRYGSLASPHLMYDICEVLNDRLPFHDDLKLNRQICRPANPLSEYDGKNPLFVLEGIQTRSTTKPQDEYLCISSIMGLELKHLAVQSSLEARSKSFYHMLADLQIPVSPEVIFC